MNKSASEMIRLLVTGRRACFRRPEFSVDLISYDTMPPTVGRQLLRSMLGHSEWTLERITVCNPVRFGHDILSTTRGERRALILLDVAYVLHAIGSASHLAACKERKTPSAHLGLTNYTATSRFLDTPDHISSSLADSGHIDLGWMIYDTNGSKTRFFRALMIDGTITVSPSNNLLLAS